MVLAPCYGYHLTKTEVSLVIRYDTGFKITWCRHDSFKRENKENTNTNTPEIYSEMKRDPGTETWRHGSGDVGIISADIDPFRPVPCQFSNGVGKRANRTATRETENPSNCPQSCMNEHNMDVTVHSGVYCNINTTLNMENHAMHLPNEPWLANQNLSNKMVYASLMLVTFISAGMGL